MSRKHETKHCPRCNAEFECKSGSILLCQCQTIFLSPEQTEAIGEQYDDCLCVNCLQALRDEYDTRQEQQQANRL
jgi:hypothetical protein